MPAWVRTRDGDDEGRGRDEGHRRSDSREGNEIEGQKEENGRGEEILGGAHRGREGDRVKQIMERAGNGGRHRLRQSWSAALRLSLPLELTPFSFLLPCFPPSFLYPHVSPPSSASRLLFLFLSQRTVRHKTSRTLEGFIWPMLVGSAVMGPRTPEHLTELEAFFRDLPKPIGAGERCGKINPGVPRSVTLEGTFFCLFYPCYYMYESASSAPPYRRYCRAKRRCMLRSTFEAMVAEKEFWSKKEARRTSRCETNSEDGQRGLGEHGEALE